MKKLLVNLLKYALPLGIVIYLIADAAQDQSFDRLKNEPKNWGPLLAAWLLCTTAVLLTFVRWYVLVRALELPFRMRDAFRLGFLGYLFNFISLGSVGGDLFKAIFIAREQPGRRAEAVASVVIDRIIGLYSLFLVASASIIFTDAGTAARASEQLRAICTATLVCTLLGAVGIFVLLVPGITAGALSEWLANLPRIGRIMERLIGAIRVYRRRVSVLLLTVAISLCVHGLFAVGFYLISEGLPGEAPSLTAHFLIIPLAMVTGVLPLLMNGLGAFEYVIDFLYRAVPNEIPVPKGQGLHVSLTYRAITIIIALIGACYYLARRREVTKVWHEAEEIAEHDQQQTSQTTNDGLGAMTTTRKTA